jgi:DNA modification methylase
MSPATLATTPRWRYCRHGEAPAAAVPRNQILGGDALEQLRALPDTSVDCVITSPPYYRLRNYGHPQQIGLEPTVEAWAERLVAVADELGRVLKPTGSLWLNLGDSYSRHDRYGAPPKSLLLAPERVLLALSARGWSVRNKVVWAKPASMPTSVLDRLNCTWEALYFLVHSRHYYFDLDAIREPHRTPWRKGWQPTGPFKYEGKSPSWAGLLAGANDGLARARAEGRPGHPNGKNPGDVWTVATTNFRGAHFATFPVRLIERPLRATCPERVCAGCGQPWRRRQDRLLPDCTCQAGWRPGVVLDPFMGSGTVALEAERLGRDWVGIELNPDYRALAWERIQAARNKQSTSGVKQGGEAATRSNGGTNGTTATT